MTGLGHFDHKGESGGSPSASMGERSHQRSPRAPRPEPAPNPASGSTGNIPSGHSATARSDGSPQVATPGSLAKAQTARRGPARETSKPPGKMQELSKSTCSGSNIPPRPPPTSSANRQTAGSGIANTPIATHSAQSFPTQSAIPQTRGTPAGLKSLKVEEAAQGLANPAASLRTRGADQASRFSIDNSGGMSPVSREKSRQQRKGANITQNVPTDKTYALRTSPAHGKLVAAKTSSSAPLPYAAVVPEAFNRQGTAGRPEASNTLATCAGPSGSSGPLMDLGAAGQSANPSGPEFRKMRLGIETEFLLEAFNPEHNTTELHRFVAILAKNHDERVNSRHPRMQRSLRQKFHRFNYAEWSIVTEPSIATGEAPWGLEMVSPILEVSPGEPWREHVAATWRYLQEFYHISSDYSCSTHIHISLLPHYTVDDLKRIASSIIHFEPAFEALVPPDRRDNENVKSNWLDSANLARKGRSRAASIAAIEAVGRCTEIMDLMETRYDKSFAWNFWSLLEKGTIEFRKPPASLTMAEALSWAEMTLNFVQAAIKYGSPERLAKVPATIKGLNWFLRQVYVPGVNQPELLNRIWAGKEEDAAEAPQPITRYGRDDEMMATLQRMSTIDVERVRSNAKSAQAPYW